ncbi:unnamed protein product [Tuber aestivum]|uniref:Uncharacterized protein n=1 Tax=Tuber aestivum TaxID=59557 RepID=A0A292PNY1_9PEZI|nr:unnamed protein product [Tuber aestivum]
MAATIFKEITDAIKTRSQHLLTFNDLDAEDFAQILQGLRHRTNHLEQYSFRIHWFAADKILKVVMPSRLHEVPAAWLFATITKASGQGLIPQVWHQTMDISPAPEYKNFVGPYINSIKEADLTFVPLVGPNWTTNAEFPTVVLESGWTEGEEQLDRDAMLWQEGSGGQVRVVIQVKFFHQEEDRIGALLRINRAHPNGATSRECYEILPPGGNHSENPSITFSEFYGGHCPPGVVPEDSLVLELESLRERARREIRARSAVPAL